MTTKETRPAPAMPAKAEPKTMSEKLAYLRSYLNRIDRELAGYETLSKLINDLNAGKHVNDRSLPILHYTGTHDYENTVNVEVELKKLDQAEVLGIILPIAKTHLMQLDNTLSVVRCLATEMHNEVRSVLPQRPAKEAQPQSAVEAEGDEVVPVYDPMSHNVPTPPQT